MALTIVGYLAISSTLVAIIPIVLWRKKLPVPLLLLLIYLTTSFVSDIASALISLPGSSIDNLWVINAYIILSMPILVPFFLSIHQNKKVLNISAVVFIIGFLLVIASTVLSDYSNDYNSVGISISTIAIMIASLLYLTDLAIYSNVSDLSRDSYIYIVTALLFSSTALVTLFMSHTFVGEDAGKLLWYLKHFTMIVLNFSIAYTAYTKYNYHRASK